MRVGKKSNSGRMYYKGNINVISIYALLTALFVAAIAERKSNRNAPKVDQNTEVSELQIRTYSVAFYLNAEGLRYLTVLIFEMFHLL